MSSFRSDNHLKKYIEIKQKCASGKIIYKLGDGVHYLVVIVICAYKYVYRYLYVCNEHDHIYLYKLITINQLEVLLRHYKITIKTNIRLAESKRSATTATSKATTTTTITTSPIKLQRNYYEHKSEIISFLCAALIKSTVKYSEISLWELCTKKTIYIDN